MGSMEIADFLASVAGFKRIDRQAIEELASQVEQRRFRAGQYLIRSGDLDDDMHVIQRGQVRVPLLDDKGQVRSTFYLGPGSIVGEMALLTGQARSADVIAEVDTLTVLIQRKTLKPMLDRYPQLAGFLTEILGQRLDTGGGIETVGKYRFLGKIGEGATGKVFAALHPGLNRIVAIKMLSHSLSYSPRFRDRFMDEARTIAGLNHPHIVQIFDTEQAYATYFIVMEKLSGVDLARVLKTRSVLPPAEATEILSQIADALAYAHSRGFAHRDVKPANVAFDERGRVKLMDFGLARPVVGEGIRSEHVEGTLQYIAPETALGEPADGRVDIYALGVMAFEMLTGRLPFKPKTPREMLEAHAYHPPPDIASIKADLPENLLRFVRGTLVKDPDKRLCDWVRIQQLLDPSEAPSGRWAPKKEEIVHIRYPPSGKTMVDRAVSALLDTLLKLDGVEVSLADLLPRARPCEGVVGSIVSQHSAQTQEAISEGFYDRETRPGKPASPPDDGAES
ncbi:MAG: protein kinase [Deltaproteobacteria bacterium]|nr:protein kinase [Deltaproteobacteria bacterium]